MSDDEYPVQDVLPTGRRRVALDHKGNPAKDPEHATGWGMLEKDRPNHRKCKSCKALPELGKTRCAPCAKKNNEKAKRWYQSEKAKGRRFFR